MDRTGGGYPTGVTPEDPKTEELKVEQVRKELHERENADEAPTEAGERTATRRADKAAYLKRKLDEQQAADADDE
ncbi:MAG: hypothetical protein QOE86_3397 [Solirubrobacteraceae bacterium]|nr:hypothetical protein [Solirubrobacteraceae bacterium]